MALDNQTFDNKPLLLLGSSFFLDDVGQPSYEVCLRMREDERLRVTYDFHFVDMEVDLTGDRIGIDPKHVCETVQAWGAPVVFGKIFPLQIDAKTVKQFQRLIVSAMKIHSTYLCAQYRYQGVKNLSTFTGEQVLVALSLASQDPEPSALTKYLLNVSRYE